MFEWGVMCERERLIKTKICLGFTKFTNSTHTHTHTHTQTNTHTDKHTNTHTHTDSSERKILKRGHKWRNKLIETYREKRERESDREGVREKERERDI